MIIRIQASGGSFRGAGQYYLHDKAADASIDNALKPQSAERVWFTETRNCMNQDPFRALDEMWGVAADQQYLKMQAGVGRGGRTCEDPVKTIAMSWHKDDAPTPEHMIESADRFLKHMGWDGHQAVYVGHNDTEHRHIHIILNRVNPENGRTLDDYRERKRAQEWALAYEREHGQVRCDQREKNARDKANGQGREAANDHLPHNVIVMTRPLEQQFSAEELQRAGHDAEAKAQLKVEQRDERKQFFADGAKLFKATRSAAYKEVREEFKDEWRDYYRDAKAAGVAADRDAELAMRRAGQFASAGQWDKALEAFDQHHPAREAAIDHLRERKADIEMRQTAAIAERQQEACDALREVREIQYQELLKRQAAERSSLQAGEALESAGVRQQPDRDATAMLWAQVPSNQNADRTEDHPAVPQRSRIALGQQALEADALAAIDRAMPLEAGAQVDMSALGPRTPEQGAALATQTTDLAAGMMGGVASYLADQLGEMFAPTPPEVREANAKAEAKRDAERPAPEPKDNAYEKIIAAAVRHVEEERARQGEEWWKERDRGKGWERDQ